MQYLLITSLIGVIILNSQAAELFDSEKENSLIPNGILLGCGRNPEESSGILVNGGSAYINESHELIRNDILPSSNGLAHSEQLGKENIKMNQYPLIQIGNEMPGVDLESQNDDGRASNALFKNEETLPLTQPILGINKSMFSLINRDLDTFYDNDLLVKINDDEDLLRNLQVESRNGDSYLTVKDQNREAYLNRINKRESKKSNQSDCNNYYDNKGGETSIKEKFKNIKRIFQYKSKNNTDETIVSDVFSSTENLREIISDNLKKKKTEATIDLNKKGPTRDVSPSIVIDHKEKNSYLNHSGITHQEIKYDGSEPLDDWLDEIPKLDHKDESGIISEQRSNNLRIKTSGRCEMGNCLPSGGLPKYQTVSFSPKKNDSFYEKAIQGDLVDKFHRTVLEKLSGNCRMANELGITPAETRDVRELYNRIRCKDTYCCKKVIEELECFLTWILTVDTSRKKRSSDKIAGDGTEHVSERCSKIGSCEDYINDFTQSPEYKKLFANVEKYKESSANSWNYDSFNLLSDSSKK